MPALNALGVVVLACAFLIVKWLYQKLLLPDHHKQMMAKILEQPASQIPDPEDADHEFRKQHRIKVEWELRDAWDYLKKYGDNPAWGFGFVKTPEEDAAEEAEKVFAAAAAYGFIMSPDSEDYAQPPTPLAS